MTIKGDIRSQRQRRRDRYRGCRVCGIRDVECTECGLGKQLVAAHGYARLSLVVDGSFVESTRNDGIDLGHGGAGLVLVCNNEILASRACGFRTASSSDAELQAVIRGARWTPGVAIYTDAIDLPPKITRINPDLSVHYLRPGQRGDRIGVYSLAHRLSVVGRSREAPETTPKVDLTFIAERPFRSRGARRRVGADLLLDHARRDPAFDGNFTALAERLGWTSGRRWQDNPSIRIATKRWAANAAPAADDGRQEGKALLSTDEVTETP